MCSPLVPRLRLVLNLSILAKKKLAGYAFLTLLAVKIAERYRLESRWPSKEKPPLFVI